MSVAGSGNPPERCEYEMKECIMANVSGATQPKVQSADPGTADLPGKTTIEDGVVA